MFKAKKWYPESWSQFGCKWRKLWILAYNHYSVHTVHFALCGNNMRCCTKTAVHLISTWNLILWYLFEYQKRPNWMITKISYGILQVAWSGHSILRYNKNSDFYFLTLLEHFKLDTLLQVKNNKLVPPLI